MADKSIVSNSKLISLADAIREKTGTTDKLTLDEMTISVSDISTGTDTSDATATSSDILLDKTAYGVDGKITGTIPTYGGDYEGEATPYVDRLKTLLDATKSCFYLFYDYTGESVDDLIKYDDTENVTKVSRMFQGCSNLVTIPLLDTSKVTAMYYMFYGCKALTSIPLLNTSNVTNMSYMFNDCFNLTTIPLLDTSNVTDMSNMFNNCRKITTIPLLDTKNVTNMSYMFNTCAELMTFPLLNTSNVTNMSYMFNQCNKLTSIPLLDTNKVTGQGMRNMFENCNKLLTVPLLNTSNISSLNCTFHNCYKLTTINLFDISNVTDMHATFNRCYSLTKVILHNSTKVPPLSTNSFTDCYHFYGVSNSPYNPEGLKDGRIYVPDDMVESFKTATNWSVFADQILPLSELPEEE